MRLFVALVIFALVFITFVVSVASKPLELPLLVGAHNSGEWQT